MKNGNENPHDCNALVLAGRRRDEDDPFAATEYVAHKSLLKADGEPLIRRVIIALIESGRISKIKIATPENIRPEIAFALTGLNNWIFADALDSPAATVLSAIESLTQRQSLVVTTSDHALLRADMIVEFLGAAEHYDAAAGCVERDQYENRFPGSRRTFVQLRGFQFSGANLFWFRGERAKGLAAFWRKLESKRKNPAAMAREIGVWTALSYATRLMTKTGLEKVIEKRTGVAAKLIPLSNAEAAIDVDKPEDLALVRTILEAR